VENAREAVPPQVTGPPPVVTVNVDWTPAAAVQPQHVNQVMAQLGNPAPDGIPDGVYIGLGSVAPPIVGGPDAAAVQKQLAELQGSTAKVDVAGRFHMSRGLLDAVIEVLQTTAAHYDAAVRQAEAARASGSEVDR
jgi:hypothetical protein